MCVINTLLLKNFFTRLFAWSVNERKISRKRKLRLLFCPMKLSHWTVFVLFCFACFFVLSFFTDCLTYCWFSHDVTKSIDPTEILLFMMYQSN